MSEEDRGVVNGEPSVDPAPGTGSASEQGPATPETILNARGEEEPEASPGTVVVHHGQPDIGKAKVYHTLHVSASSKARARIRVCEKCNHDNIADARFCEVCGEDINEQERRREIEESRKELEKYAKRVVKVGPDKDAKTVFRRSKTPPMQQPPKDIEKKSYQSHYIPAGSPAGQYDPTAFRSDQQLVQSYQQQPIPVQVQQQYIPVPVGYVAQPVPVQQAPGKERSVSLIVGIVVSSVLAVLLIALVVIIVVLAID